MWLADVIGENTSPIPAFGSFKGASNAPTSIILFLFLILNMSRHVPDPNKQTKHFLYIFDKVIEIAINNTINNTKGNILYNNLKNIGNNFEYYIHEDFRRRK